MIMSTAALYEPLRAGFAEAYATAARVGANMRAVTHAVEFLRESLLANGDILELWAAFDDQLGHASTSAFQPAMSELHAQFVDVALGSLVHEAAGGGASAWCTTFARAFGDGNWRHDLLRALNAAQLPAVADLPAPFNEHARLQALEEQIASDRWSETYDWFVFLGHHPELGPELRLRMLVITAEIQLYHFRRPSRVRGFLDEAAALAPEHPRLLIGRGSLHLELNTPQDLKEAEDCFTKVIASRPRLSDGYLNLGELKERAGDFPAAKSLYQEAIANAPGSVDGYRRLYRLFGKPQWFESRAERRADLARRMKILQDDDAVQCVEEGGMLRANAHWEEARAAYRAALALKPRFFSAHYGLGLSWLDEAADGKTPPERSVTCLAAMNESVASILAEFPAAPDAHWLDIWGKETAKDWQGVIRRMEALREFHPEWEPATRLRAAAAWRNLGHLAEARTELARVLELGADHTSLPFELNELGEAAYRASDRELAHYAFAEARRLRGDSAEYDYLNRLGNLNFWFSEYDAAEDHYRRAATIKPDDAVLHSNLALALARIVRAGRQEEVVREEVAALLEAQRLVPTELAYAERLADARRRLDFLTRYGETALAYKHTGILVRVLLSPELVPLIAKEGPTGLAPDVLVSIEEVGNRIRREAGVIAQGWLFSGFASLHCDMMYINVLNEAPSVETLSPGDAQGRVTQMIERTESAMRPFLAQFVSHQDTVAALEAITSPASREIVSEPRRLTAFVRFLRGVVAGGASIADLAPLVEHFAPPAHLPSGAGERWPARTWEDPLPGVDFTVMIGRELAAQMEAAKAELEQLRMSVLELAGVLLPLVTVREDHELPPFGFRMILDGEPLISQDGLHDGELWVAQPPDQLPPEWKAQPYANFTGTPGAIVSATVPEVEERFPGVSTRTPSAYASYELGVALTRVMASFIDTAQVEHRLALIASSHPTLVKSVRTQFTCAEVVELLRQQLGRGRFLRSFAHALEDLLSSEAVAE